MWFIFNSLIRWDASTKIFKTRILIIYLLSKQRFYLSGKKFQYILKRDIHEDIRFICHFLPFFEIEIFLTFSALAFVFIFSYFNKSTLYPTYPFYLYFINCKDKKYWKRKLYRFLKSIKIFFSLSLYLRYRRSSNNNVSR